MRARIHFHSHPRHTDVERKLNVLGLSPNFAITVCIKNFKESLSTTMSFQCRAPMEKVILTQFRLPLTADPATYDLGTYRIAHHFIQGEAVCRPRPNGDVEFRCRGHDMREEEEPSTATFSLTVGPSAGNEPQHFHSFHGLVTDYDLSCTVPQTDVEEWKRQAGQADPLILMDMNILVAIPKPCPFALEKQKQEEFISNARSNAFITMMDEIENPVTLSAHDGTLIRLPRETLQKNSSIFNNLIQGEEVDFNFELPVGPQALNIIWNYFAFSRNFLNALQTTDYSTIKELMLLTDTWNVSELFNLAVFQLPRLMTANNAKDVEEFIQGFQRIPPCVLGEVQEFIENQNSNILSVFLD